MLYLHLDAIGHISFLKKLTYVSISAITSCPALAGLEPRSKLLDQAPTYITLYMIFKVILKYRTTRYFIVPKCCILCVFYQNSVNTTYFLLIDPISTL